MKTITFLFMLIAGYSFSQNESNIWYFGTNAGIDFNSGAPVILTDGMTSQQEGTAVMCDNAGDLLFYTDGINVWNKNHGIMTNGNNLSGGSSSTQSALIVLQPGSDSLYYIFTVSQQLAPGGLRYSIADMSLQGGLGEVIVKNILLDVVSTEKITTVPHGNNSDFWILAHDWNNNDFQAYQLSATGINTTPVTSSAGTVHSGSSGNTIGYLKASHDHSKLALAVYEANFFELFDFDMATGIVSNPIFLNSLPGGGNRAYGVQFSPDDTKLYGSLEWPPSIVQWDVTLGSSSAINASQIIIGTSTSYYGGTIQLAPDGKIYFARNSGNLLGAINDPNAAGLACNYDDSALNVSPGICQIGLPNYSAYLNGSPQSPDFSVSDTLLCQKFCIDFFDSSTNNPTSWLWQFPGGSPSSSTDQNPTGICYNSPGTYDVTLITTNTSGTDTLTLLSYITVYPTPSVPAITQIGNTLTSSPADFYQWQFNTVDIPGATNQSYTVTQTGFYTVVVTDTNGCFAATTIHADITGVEDLLSDFNFSIYPNPSDGNFVIEFENTGMTNKITIAVSNTVGQVIFIDYEKNSLADVRKEIHLTNVADGVYFVEIKSDQISLRKKIIILE